MYISQDTTYLLIGGLVGFTSSTIGALVDYLISRKRDPGAVRLPGCMLLIAGGLGFAGVGAALLSYLLAQSLRPVMWAGIGVLGGFFISFVILALGWLFIVGSCERGIFSERE